jgi:hypothetical protein
MIEDYAYAGLDFRGDPDLILPEDTQWGDIGKKVTNFSSFKMFLYFYHIKCFLVLYLLLKTNTKMY